MSSPRSQHDYVGNFLVVLLVVLVLGFLFSAYSSGQYAMSRCLERFSETTCNHTLGR